MIKAAKTTDMGNKAIVDYTSPALYTPVTPFSPIGDAAYREQHSGEGPSHGHRQHVLKIGKDRACGFGDILADRETQRQRYTLQYFATVTGLDVPSCRRRASYGLRKRESPIPT